MGFVFDKPDILIICLQVPTFAYEKRLSRIETLRLAITYISFMDELLATPVPGPGGVSCRRGTGQVGGHGQPRGVPHLTPRGEELLSNHINPFAGINGGSAMCQQDLSKWCSFKSRQKYNRFDKDWPQRVNVVDLREVRNKLGQVNSCLNMVIVVKEKNILGLVV